MEANLVSGTQNDFLRLFVNPTSTDLSSQTADLTAILTPGGNGTDPTGLGALLLSQFANATTTANSAVTIGQVVVGSDFSEVVNAVPEPGALTLALVGGLMLLRRRMRKD